MVISTKCLARGRDEGLKISLNEIAPQGSTKEDPADRQEKERERGQAERKKLTREKTTLRARCAGTEGGVEMSSPTSGRSIRLEHSWARSVVCSPSP